MEVELKYDEIIYIIKKIINLLNGYFILEFIEYLRYYKVKLRFWYFFKVKLKEVV